MSSSIANHIRTNVVGYAALFVALSGTVYAADKVGSTDIRAGAVKSKQIGDNKVKSKDLQDGKAVKSRDVKDGTLTEVDIAGESLTGESIEDDSLTAADIDESTLPSGGSPSGPAGGDLSGSYPDPQIASSAVGSNKVADDSLTGADIDEDTLGTVPNASQLNGISSSGYLRTNATAGGDLSGNFSNLQLNANSVTGSEVNESTLGKVPDADTLDGVNSTSFLKGTMVRSTYAKSSPTPTRTFAALPGVGEIIMTCTSTNAQVRFKNTSGQSLGIYIDDSDSGVSQTFPNNGNETTTLTTASGRRVVYRTFLNTAPRSVEWDVFFSTTGANCHISLIRTND